MRKILNIALASLLMIAMLIIPGKDIFAGAQAPSINYRVHGQSYGWQGYVSDGTIAGTTGQSKRLESLIVQLGDKGAYTGSVTYRVHQQTYGWSDWVGENSEAGITGESKRLESIQIQLTGDLAESYDICYRVHQQSYGWSSWVRNGGQAGVIGQNKRLEAVQIQILPKGESVTTTTPTITYQSHVQSYGWLNTVGRGAISGTTGQSKRLESYKINISNKNGLGGINYRAYVQGIGWQDYVGAGQIAGTVGKSKRLEAIQVKLTGQLADLYDVYYRVHVQKYGWSGWAKNGATAGSTGISARSEAIQIQLVEKGSAAPGSTSSTCWTLNSVGGYNIMVNKQACCVTVYAGKIPVKAMICSPGEATPTGTYSTMTKYRWTQLNGGVNGQFCTRIVDHILFHSVPYSAPNNHALITKYYNQLGTLASAGCVRLTAADAKWIYDNCPLGTTVTIYNSSDPGPLGKPSAAKLPNGQTWDPTDPTL